MTTPLSSSLASWSLTQTKLNRIEGRNTAVAINDSQILIIGASSVELLDADSANSTSDDHDHVLNAKNNGDAGCYTITQMIRLPTAATRSFHTASVINGKHVYICGGVTVRGTPTKIVERLPLSTNLTPNTPWQSVQPMNEFRSTAMSVTVGGYLYVFGGYNGGIGKPLQYLSTGECYDPLTNKWEYLPEMPIPRAGAAVIAVGTKIYLIGGKYGMTNATLSSVHVYDVKSRKWDTKCCPDIPIPLSLTKAVVLGGMFIFLVGGRDDANYQIVVDTDKSFILNTQANDKKWTETRWNLSCPRAGHSTTILECRQELLTICGFTNREYLDSIEKISLLPLMELKWFCMKLRLIVHYGRGVPLDISNDETENLKTVQQFIINTNDDIFRTVLEFLY